MFRSFRNPVTKTGRTSNTTGSRIRSSARTLRENTVSLVEAAKARVRQTAPGQGYTDATAKRKNTASADYAGENARKKAYGAGAGKFGQRQAKYQGMKSASAPAGSTTGYKAGYAVGKQVAASRYKSGLSSYSPGGRTGLEKNTGKKMALVARREATDAYRAGASTVRETASTVAIGAKQVARGAVRGGKVVGKVASGSYKAGQKVVFGTQDALRGVARGFRYAAQGNLQTAKYSTMNALNAAKYGRSRLDRMAAPINAVAERGLSLVARGGSAAILAAGRGVSKVAGAASGAYKNRRYAKARTAWNAANPPKMKRAGVFGNTGMQQTPMGKNSVAQGIRYQAAMAKKQAKQSAPAQTAAAAPQPKGMSTVAKARYANAQRMRNQGYTPQQITAAAKSMKRGSAFTQKPAGAAKWGGKAAPNWSAYQPTGGSSRPPQAAPQTQAAAVSSATGKGYKQLRPKVTASGGLAGVALAKAIRQKKAPQSGSPVRSLRDMPDYNSPIIPKGSTYAGNGGVSFSDENGIRARSYEYYKTPEGKMVQKELLPESVAQTVENVKRGRGRPKLTDEQRAASAERKKQLRRENRQKRAQ